MMLRRPCPLCGHGFGMPLHAQLFAPLDAGEPDGYLLVTCARCGFGFADLARSQATADAAYRETSVPTERAVDLERLEATAGLLADALPAGARVLDAGCGTGALLAYLADRGLPDAVGLDAARGAVACAIARGRDARLGTLSAPPPDLGTFDAIVLAHVLEHVVDLHDVVRALQPLLRPGGAVYAETPDGARYDAWCFEPFHDVNSEHVNHFSLDALGRLFARHGYLRSWAEEALVDCAPGLPYPVVRGLWRAPGAGGARSPADVPEPFDDVLADALERYVARSLELLDRLAVGLRHDLAGAPEIALWGAGEFARRLAVDTRFAGSRVAAVVDGAPLLQGRRFLGVTIEPPERLAARPDLPIVVGSLLGREAIAAAIRARGLPNRIVLPLRPEPAAGAGARRYGK